MQLARHDVPGPKSRALLDRSRRNEPPSMADQLPLVWDHAEDVWVYDVDGNRYLDFTRSSVSPVPFTAAPTDR
jgi:4-aminobutyrate aminotransferase-like enzyme